jgi:glycosyltransferase involved in cell wall biosynthesis
VAFACNILGSEEVELRDRGGRGRFRAVRSISIVVPAFNEEKLLPETLRAIRAAAAAFTEAGWEWELIVCDNNSTDRTAELARAAGARVVFEPVNQIGRARNTGAAAATGDWLLFIDADSAPSRALFAELAAALADGRTLAGGAPVRLDRFDWRVWFFTGVWNTISRWLRWAAGSFLYCEAAAFRAVGGFSGELFASEEIDLSKRLKLHARERGRRLTILRTPLLTSARKLELYQRGEILWFCLRAACRPYATVKAREACHIWYDGRR